MMAEIISENTPIAIGAAVALVLGACSVAIWILRELASIKTGQVSLDSKWELFAQEIRQRLADGMTTKEFYSFVFKLKTLNPELKFPEDFF
jgi:hypothetical protein